jgi:hypothetical protein
MKYIAFLLALSVGWTAVNARTAEDAIFARQNIVIVLDDSGSMDESMRVGGQKRSKMEVAKDSLKTVIKDLRGNTSLGIYLLNRGWLVSLGELDKSATLRQIDGVDASGGTPLGRAIKEGTDALLEQRQKERYGSYRLLVVTDGEANDENLLERYIGDVLSRGIVVDVIGVAMKDTHTLASRAHSYRRGDNPDSLTQALSEVLAETGGTSDTAEADFEIAAALSDELAGSIISTLAETSIANHPIVTEPVAPTVNQTSQGSSTAAVVAPLGSSPLMMIMIILGVIFGVFVISIIISVLNS